MFLKQKREVQDIRIRGLCLKFPKKLHCFRNMAQERERTSVGETHLSLLKEKSFYHDPEKHIVNAVKISSALHSAVCTCQAGLQGVDVNIYDSIWLNELSLNLMEQTNFVALKHTCIADWSDTAEIWLMCQMDLSVGFCESFQTTSSNLIDDTFLTLLANILYL